MVICGKYKNLNKIIKKLTYLLEILKFNRLLVFDIPQSLQYKIEGSVLICKDQRECREQKKNYRNSIVNENALNSEGSLLHYEGRPSTYLFKLFLKLLGGPEENSSYFSNVQLFTITRILDAFINNRI